VVTLHSGQTRSAEQARAFGKALLMWCAQRSTESKILPDNMVPPEARTTEQKQEIVECWLQHGELSIVARRQKARNFDKWKRHDRTEQEPPWMVTMTLSDASMPSGGYLGKMVGATALGFEMRDAPHYIKRKMQGHIRRWHNAKDKDDKKRKGSGQTPPRGNKAKRGTSNVAWVMGGGGLRRRSRRNRVEVGPEALGRVDARAARAMG
jgi:hypothetical protein